MSNHIEQNPTRIHAFDRLRAVAMIWGVFFHSALAFTERTPVYWVVQDPAHAKWVDLFAWASHRSRMPVFFILTGLSAQFLLQKIGSTNFLIHRFKRVLIPYGLALLTIAPLNSAIWIWADIQSCSPHKSICFKQFPDFFSNEFWATIIPGHLWFLSYLLIYSILFVATQFVLTHHFPRLTKTTQSVLTKVMASPARAFLLAVPVAIPLLFMSNWSVPDTPIDFSIRLPSLCYYGSFFAFGAIFACTRHQLHLFSQWPKTSAACSLILFMTLVQLILNEAALRPAYPILNLLVPYLSAVFTMSTALLLIGWFYKSMQAESKPWRYLTDASYWIYLWHVPLIASLQVTLMPLDLHPLLKYGFISGTTLALTILSYQLVARYTLIGTLLHGRRQRAPAN